MKVTSHTISSRAEQIQRAEERRAKVANFLKGVLAALAFGALFYAALEIPSAIHSRHCEGCDWFWCDNYSGNGEI